jgi:hypothetical protein
MSIFSEQWEELLRLRALGLTDHAILVYLVKVHKGKPEETALDVLLRGRSLSGDQIGLIRALLLRLYMRMTRGHSAEANG